jgi:hypothetical protein
MARRSFNQSYNRLNSGKMKDRPSCDNFCARVEEVRANCERNKRNFLGGYIFASYLGKNENGEFGIQSIGGLNCSASFLAGTIFNLLADIWDGDKVDKENVVTILELMECCLQLYKKTGTLDDTSKMEDTLLEDE